MLISKVTLVELLPKLPQFCFYSNFSTALVMHRDEPLPGAGCPIHIIWFQPFGFQRFMLSVSRSPYFSSNLT